ncbi:MAG: NAD-dependent epimerase/dehydratase family protein [Candidatus Zixiibacteriota bacterium]
MKVFITGTTGYIGNAVARAMRRAGHDVFGLVRSEPAARQLAAQEIQPVLGRMQDAGTYSRVAEECSVIIHAAVDYSDRTAESPLLDALLAGAGKGATPKTFIYTSGVWVYGNTGLQSVDETTPLTPAALVTWRPAVERRVLESSGIRGVVIRPGCVYGQRGGLTAEWMMGATGQKPFRVIGDGENRWTMVHVEDLAQAYVLAAESGRSGEVFNVTDRSRSRIREMAEGVAAVAGFKDQIQYIPVSKAAETLGGFAECLALDQHVDSSKAVRLLGWQPRHGGFLDGVRTYFEAWRASQA